ncbi:MAG: MFS transporter [Chloroflexi bacterium]|nr:MFS transporter [Chloroflexota bacterium]
MKLPRIAEPLRHRDFRLLWIGQTVTLLGTSISNVAFPFQILQLGGSAVELGTFISVYAVSSVVFLLVGGAVADRLPRRTLIIVTELASAAIMATLAVLGFSGSIQIWHLYVAVVYFGAATAFAVPALMALIPELIPEDILLPGNALRGLSRHAGRVAGPVIGGILVGLASPAAAFAFDAATFGASAVAVAFTRARPLPPRARSSMLADIREGLGFVFSVEWLWVTIFGFAAINAAFIGASAVGLPLLVTTVMLAGPATYGTITAAIGAGEILGSIVIGQIRIRRSGLAMYLFAVAGGIAVAVYGLVPTLTGALVASVGSGFAFVAFGVLWESALQRHVPRALLGRVTSVDWFGGTLLAPVAPLGAALVAESFGPASLLAGAGLVMMLLAAAGLVLPSIRRLE